MQSKKHQYWNDFALTIKVFMLTIPIQNFWKIWGAMIFDDVKCFKELFLYFIRLTNKCLMLKC